MNLCTASYLLLSLFAVTTSAAQAGVQTKTIEYKQGDLVLEGFLAWDDAVATAAKPAPGVVVCPEWWGNDEYARGRAKQLAELGYVAFSIDMYGKGKVTKDPKVATEWSGAVYADLPKSRERVALGLAQLTAQPFVDKTRCAAIGYCMGGTVALELARSGADLRSIVAFHTSSLAARGNDAEALALNQKIRATITVCHGQDDAFVQADEITKFHAQMKAAKLDYTFTSYAGAVHSFTNPKADGFGIPGVAYDAKADARSWALMKSSFAEAFAAKR
jgi:dienelactone hydrolase